LFLFVVVAAVLLWAQGSILYFSLALTAFFTVDHMMWFYLKRFLRSSVAQSRAQYKTDGRYFDLEILNTVDRQVMGDWKYKRLAAGAVVILLIDLFTFSRSFRSIVVQLLGDLVFWLPTQEVSNLTYTALFFIFVAVMELWHWVMRIATAMRINALEDLAASYELVPSRT